MDDFHPWVSAEDKQAFERDMMLHGNAVRRTLPDGRFEHVPLEDWMFAPAPAPTVTIRPALIGTRKED